MSHQLTFADSEFSSKRRQTRKEIFLSRMEQILPWQNMVEVIEPFYPKAGNGRRPYPLETMLRIHCMQHWYNLSDGAMEDALYEIDSMRHFAGLKLLACIGIVGYILKKLDYPLAPLVPGVVLGTIAETNLRHAFQTSTDWNLFFTRPISALLLALAIASIAYSVYSLLTSSPPSACAAV